jgi:hypothetical protein
MPALFMVKGPGVGNLAKIRSPAQGLQIAVRWTTVHTSNLSLLTWLFGQAMDQARDEEDRAMETRWLPCSVSPGQFPNEYAVSGMQYNGKGFSLFAPREMVSAPPSGEGEGLMQVEVVDRRNDLALVRLPAQSFENGQHITVDANTLRSAPGLQKVGT